LMRGRYESGYGERIDNLIEEMNKQIAAALEAEN
jgi:hypothetical protein